MHLMSFRNGVQDLIHATLFTGLDPEARDGKMRRQVQEAQRKEESIRMQVFTMYRCEVDSVMRELRALNATAPCSDCNGTGKRMRLDGPPAKCPTCKGTGWEMLL